MVQYLWSMTMNENCTKFYLSSMENSMVDAEIEFQPVDPDMGGLVIPKVRIPLAYIDPCNAIIIKASNNGCHTVINKKDICTELVNTEIYKRMREIARAYVNFHRTLGIESRIFKISIPIECDD